MVLPKFVRIGGCLVAISCLALNLRLYQLLSARVRIQCGNQHEACRDQEVNAISSRLIEGGETRPIAMNALSSADPACGTTVSLR
jgi:hypothetical protein